MMSSGSGTHYNTGEGFSNGLGYNGRFGNNKASFVNNSLGDNVNTNFNAFGPSFQFPKGQEEYYQKNYPAFYNFVKNQLPNIIQDKNFLQAFMDITGMSQEEVTKAFTYGEGPTLHDAYLSFGEGQYDYSVTGMKEDINSISIDIPDALNWFEKADKNPNTLKGLTNLFSMAALVGHEGSHWGSGVNGNPNKQFMSIFLQEEGNAFEFKLYNNLYPDAKVAPGILHNGHPNNPSKYLKNYVQQNFQTLSNIFQNR
jgi:hypothetical protein